MIAWNNKEVEIVIPGLEPSLKLNDSSDDTLDVSMLLVNVELGI